MHLLFINDHFASYGGQGKGGLVIGHAGNVFSCYCVIVNTVHLHHKMKRWFELSDQLVGQAAPQCLIHIAWFLMIVVDYMIVLGGIREVPAALCLDHTNSVLRKIVHSIILICVCNKSPTFTFC
jgi:uncharacterized membrane protein YkvI